MMIKIKVIKKIKNKLRLIAGVINEESERWKKKQRPWYRA
jgi:hypothetical protein